MQQTPQLNNIDRPGRLYPAMKAVQLWSLLRYLPLIVGDLVPTDNKHWHFLLHLSELVDLLFCPVFSIGMVTYLRELIADHLSMFVELYSNGENGVRLKPKHHLLIHMPTVILQSGPLVEMNCMRYELKNSFLKRCAHTICNFSNVCKTLAYRHQQQALFARLSNSSIRNVVTVNHSSLDSVTNYSCADALCSHFGIEHTDDVCVAKRIERASVVYKVGHHVIIGIDEEPQFGRIEMFVSLPSSDDWLIVVSRLKTVNFCAHYHSYKVEYEEPKMLKILTFDELTDIHTVCCYKKIVLPVSLLCTFAVRHLSITSFRGVRLAENDFGSVFGSVLQKNAVFGSVSVLLN